MKKIFNKMNILLNAKQKFQMILLIIFMFMGAILETASIALIIPIITLIIAPNAIVENEYLNAVYVKFNFESQLQLTIFILLLLIVAFAIKNIIIFIQQKWLYYFIYTNQFMTAKQLMYNYIHKDYEFFLNADTTVIQREVGTDVNNMYSLIMAVLSMISEVVMFSTLAFAILVTDFTMAIIMSIVLIITLLLVKKVLKPTLVKAGKENQEYGSLLYKTVAQSITGIKEVKVMQRESYFLDEYNERGKVYVQAVKKYNLFNNVPRLLIETVFIAAVVGYMIIILLTNESMGAVLPIITAFGLAAARLLPCANRITAQLNNIAFFEPFFMQVANNLKDESKQVNNLEIDNVDAVSKLEMKKEIQMNNITYAYPNTEKNIFTNANMSIKIGTSVGVKGTTGSGKSTIIDILLGLLKVKEGNITVDGVDINNNYEGWLQNVGYIPQMIFMLDDTIKGNVAFGIKDEDISEEQIWNALREAQLDEFVRSLPEGLDTKIGERGIRISGGQRQRIGIARALYSNPEVLILDEATSALDNDTEAAIMDSINRLHGKKTLIIIAHRLQTIEKCDVVYEVMNEKIVLKESKSK